MEKLIFMQGVRFLTNEKNERIAVQIDLKLLSKRQAEIEDFLDGILAESREEEESISWEEAKEELRKGGKL